MADQSPIDRALSQAAADFAAQSRPPVQLPPPNAATRVGSVLSQAPGGNVGNSALNLIGERASIPGMSRFQFANPGAVMGNQAGIPGLARFTVDPDALLTRTAPSAARGVTGMGALNTAETVASLYPGAATTATGGGRIASAASRVSSPFQGMMSRFQGLGGGGAGVAGTEGAAGGLSRFAPTLSRGALMRGAGYLGAGMLAGNLVEGVTGSDDGTFDDALRNMAVGAGAGAAGGSLFAGIGALPGAIVGGATGFAHGLLTGRDDQETEHGRAVQHQTERITEVLNEAGASPELREMVLQQLNVNAATVPGRRDVNTIGDNIIAALPGAIMEDAAQQTAQRERQANIAAAQAWMTPMLSDQIARSNYYALDAQNAMMGVAAQLPPELRAAAQARAAMVPLANSQLNASNLQQLQLVPQMYGYNTGTDPNTGSPMLDPLSVLSASQMTLTPSGQLVDPALLADMAGQTMVPSSAQ